MSHFKSKTVYGSNGSRLVKCFLLGIVGNLLVTTANADQNRLTDRYIQKRQAAEQQAIQLFKQGVGARDYARPLFELSKYETYMTATGGIGINDVRLVGHLADEAAFQTMSTYDYPRFVLRIIEHRLEQRIGVDISSGNPLMGQRFKIVESR